MTRRVRALHPDSVHHAPAPGMQVPPNFPLTTLVAESGQLRLYKVTGCS